MGRGPASEPVAGLGHRLRVLRAEAKLTQQQVCDRVREAGGDLSRVYYQQIESGVRHPSPALRERIMQAMAGADDLADRAPADSLESAIAQLRRLPPRRQTLVLALIEELSER